jgi:CheY-like chemotaxis protein
MTPRANMNFNDVTALLVERDHQSVTILSQVLRGFGLERQFRSVTGEQAKACLETSAVNICFCEADLSDMRGVDLVRWIRRHSMEKLRYMSVIVLSGYTQLGTVEAARDAGANFVVKKPVSPLTLYDRIAWSVQGRRQFVESPEYVGPDRRFKSLGPPGGVGRRAMDLPAEIGAATEPNMSQDEIDAFVKPMRIVTT